MLLYFNKFAIVEIFAILLTKLSGLFLSLTK